MENLGIDIKLMIAQLINLVLFFIIVKKFVASPFLAFLTEERKKEKEKQKLQEQSTRLEADMLERQKKMEAKMKTELEKALQTAKTEAARAKKEMLEEARGEASAIMESAKNDIQAEKEKLYREVKNKVAELSLAILSKGLGEALDTQMKKKVSQKILSSLPKESSIYEN